MSDVFTNLCARNQAITSLRQASEAGYGTLTLRPWACHPGKSWVRERNPEAGDLQRQLHTPLCADESAESIEALASLIENDAARIINIKVQRVGGLSEARLMLAVARAAGLECWVGTMPELGVASAQG